MKNRRLILIGGCAFGVLLSGCVTETTTSNRRQTGSREVTPAATRTGSVTSPNKQTVSLDRPVARPALSASRFNSRMRYAIKPMGRISYDGQVLPQHSPDGRFIAVQVGEAPHWETLLDADVAVIPAATRLEIYELTDGGAVKVPIRQAIPTGALLGHWCDEQSFAIELPQADGTRWAGRVRWVDGAIDWIAQEPGKSVTSLSWQGDGTVAYLIRDLGEHNRSLVIERGGARQLMLLEARNTCFVRPTGVMNQFIGFVETSAGIEIVRWAIDANRLGGIREISRFRISAAHDPLLAYQSMIAVDGSPSLLAIEDGTSEQPADELTLFFHPSAGRMMAHSRATGRIMPLTEHSIAGCWVNDDRWPGVLLTTPDGLTYQGLSDDSRGMLAFSEGVEVMAEPMVARACATEERPFLLIGPGDLKSADPAAQRLSVSFLSLSPGPDDE